jgi:hypothetical protein
VTNYYKGSLVEDIKKERKVQQKEGEEMEPKQNEKQSSS